MSIRLTVPAVSLPYPQPLPDIDRGIKHDHSVFGAGRVAAEAITATDIESRAIANGAREAVGHYQLNCHEPGDDGDDKA